MSTTGAPGSTTGPSSTNAPTTTVSAPGNAQACCGDYPMRYPYRHRNGMTQCCGSATYNSNLHCCADEDTSTLGSFGSCYFFLQKLERVSLSIRILQTNC